MQKVRVFLWRKLCKFSCGNPYILPRNPHSSQRRLFFLLCEALQLFPGNIFQQIKQKNWVLDTYLTAEGVNILVLCDENNSRINESVVRVQLDTYEVHHQTCHCRAERGAKRRAGSQYRANRSRDTQQERKAAVHLLQAVAGG